VGERGCHKEGEYERGESPERSVEVGSGRQVGGSVGRREGVESVDAAKEDLSSKKKKSENSVFRVRKKQKENALFWY
jgi:hypothetical protein